MLRPLNAPVKHTSHLVQPHGPESYVEVTSKLSLRGPPQPGAPLICEGPRFMVSLGSTISPKVSLTPDPDTGVPLVATW